LTAYTRKPKGVFLPHPFPAVYWGSVKNFAHGEAREKLTIEEAMRLHEHIREIDGKATRLKMIGDLTGGALGKNLEDLGEQLKISCQNIYRTFWNQNDD